MTLNRATRQWPVDEIDLDDVPEAAARTIRQVDNFTEEVIRFLDNRQRPVDRTNVA